MTKLTREMWIKTGLDALREKGFTALKADVLSKKLKVTRGSFYGYFQNIDAFHDAIFDAWLAQSTKVAAELEGAAAPREQLAHLVTSAAKADLALERAIRAWAHADAVIAHRVQEVDEFRLAALSAVVSSANVDRPEVRSKLIYATALGAAYLPNSVREMSDRDLEFLLDAYTK